MTMGSAPWEGVTLAGDRYRITAKPGEGGMGLSDRAVDQNIDAEVVDQGPPPGNDGRPRNSPAGSLAESGRW